MAGSMMCVYCTARNASAGSTCWWQETQNQRGRRVVSPSHRDRAQNQDTKFHELPASTRGSCLYLGLRSLLGLITLPALTGPTRSRAIARTSFLALNGFGFFAIALIILPQPALRQPAMPADRMSRCHKATDPT